MVTEANNLEIYTIGHSNVPASRIIELLAKYQIEVVVDVRSAPYSQYTPQFNRETLIQVLTEAGIGYSFAGEYLGGRPKDPTCYKNGELPAGKANYLKLVDYGVVATRPWYQKGIARLLEIAAERRTVIMCSEEDPQACHRHHLIAQTLLEMGVTVWHIRGQDVLEAALARIDQEQSQQPRQLSLFD